MFSKTVAKYLARGMHDACKNHEYDDIRELYAIGIIPTQDDVRSALSFSNVLGEIVEYKGKSAAEKYFNEKVLITFDTLLDCGVDMSEYVVELLRSLRAIDSDFILNVLEFVVTHFDHTKAKSLNRQETVNCFMCVYTYSYDYDVNCYINFRIFHLLVYNGVSKIIDKTSMSTIPYTVFSYGTYSSYSTIFSRNSILKTFIASIDEDNLLHGFPCKQLLPGFLQSGRGVHHAIETTFAIDLLITS